MTRTGIAKPLIEMGQAPKDTNPARRDPLPPQDRERISPRRARHVLVMGPDHKPLRFALFIVGLHANHAYRVSFSGEQYGQGCKSDWCPDKAERETDADPARALTVDKIIVRSWLEGV